MIYSNKGLPPSNEGDRKKWFDLGLHQFEFLKKEGLKPQHTLLDIGCGALRGGVHYIKYLNTGGYFAIDKEKRMIDFATSYVESNSQLRVKEPSISQAEDFVLPWPDTFDYMLAQSVFSHLSPEWIDKCLCELTDRLMGKFYFTFHDANEITLSEKHRWRKAGEEYRKVTYPQNFFEDLAVRFGLSFQYVGPWGHNKGQKMAYFSCS